MKNLHGDRSGNGGRATMKGTRGQSFKQDYARDNSTLVNGKKEERFGKLSGSPTDVSHSISGASVKRM